MVSPHTLVGTLCELPACRLCRAQGGQKSVALSESCTLDTPQLRCRRRFGCCHCQGLHIADLTERGVECIKVNQKSSHSAGYVVVCDTSDSCIMLRRSQKHLAITGICHATKTPSTEPHTQMTQLPPTLSVAASAIIGSVGCWTVK